MKYLNSKFINSIKAKLTGKAPAAAEPEIAGGVASDEDSDPGVYISSRFPYTVGHHFDEPSGMEIFTTFTAPWSFKPEYTEKPIECPVKLGQLVDGTFHLSVYVPSKELLETLSNYPGDNTLISVWLFLDNEEFIIIVPEEVNTEVRVMKNNQPTENTECMTIYYFDLSKAGFHSDKKKLQEIMTPQEINKFIIDELCKHDIVAFQPHLLCVADEPVELTEIPIVSRTAPTIAGARKALELCDKSGF